MNRFVVIIPYFGQFKPSICLFLESCNRNPDVDWLVFTDCEIPDRIHLNENICWNRITLEEVKLLTEKKLQREVRLERAYKLCDLKPFYGLIFEDYLSGYEYWGFGDVDVIYGRLTKYLKCICYEKYDKINWMGHLCFIRNDDRCNRAALTSVEGAIEADEVLSNSGNIGYDERDYNQKCIANGIKIHTGSWAADIDIFYWRMRCVDIKTLHFLLNTTEVKYAPKNYSKQLFAVIHGSVYRVYLRRHKVHYEEFAYVHFRKEVPIKFEDYSKNTYIITREGFESVEAEVLQDYNNVKNLIRKCNNQEGSIREIYRFLYQYCRKISGKRGW